MRKRLSCLGLATLPALLFTAATTLALPARAASTAMEEVVVTAQRSEESIQDVPISVTALTGEMLEDKGIINPSDLQLAAPNVSFTATNFGGSSFSIRGIGRLVISNNGDNGVSTHINEIPLGTNLNAVEYFDVERVEILRGPQGTLYGRNATGGVVNMITKMPNYDALEGFADVEYGDYNNIRLKGALNIPIGDNMGFRIAGFSLTRDGYTENKAAASVSSVDDSSIPNIDDDIDGREIISYRGTFSWDFSDNGKVWVQYNYFDEDDDRARLTNQVCKRTDQPALGCEPDSRGFFDSPHLGATTGGIFFMANGRGPARGATVPEGAPKAVVGQPGAALGNGARQGTLPFGTPGGPDDDNVTYDHLAPELDLRSVFTDFEPVFKYEEIAWLWGAEYEFDTFTIGLLGAYQETDYLQQMDYNMDVGPLLHPAPQPHKSGVLGALFGYAPGTWPTSAPAAGAGGDVTGARGCSYSEGTSGIFGGCVHPHDGKRLFSVDQVTANTEYWSVELRLSSQLEGRFNYQVGYTAYESKRIGGDYYVSTNGLDTIGLYGPAGLAPIYPTQFNVPGAVSDPGTNEGTALFGELYFDITDKLKLTIGLRQNEDEKFVNDASGFVTAVDQNTVFAGFLIAAGGADSSNPATFGPAIAALQGVALDPEWQQALLSLPGVGPKEGENWTNGYRWARGHELTAGGEILIGNNPDGMVGTADDGRYNEAQHKQFEVLNIPEAVITAAENSLPFSMARANLANMLGTITGFNEIRALQDNPTTADWSATTGRIGIDYQLNDDVLIFGFLTRGYKPGGFNPPVSPQFQDDTSFTFEKEDVDAIEVGAKSTLLDGQLTLNGSFFFYDYTGLQVTRIRNNASINENIDANIMGAEVEWVWQPSALGGNLALDGSFSWLNTELQDVMSVDVTNKTAGNPDWINLANIDPGALTATNYIARVSALAAGVTALGGVNAIQAAYARVNANGAPSPGAVSDLIGVTVPGTVYPNGIPAYFSRAFLENGGMINANAATPGADPLLVRFPGIGKENVSSGIAQNLKGNQLPNSPEFTFRLGAQYTMALDALAGTLTFRWDYYWQGDSYAREFNTKGDEIDAWDQHNLSFIYESNNNDWQVRLWIRNIQDEDNVTGHYLTSDTSGYFRNYFLTEPRLFGLTARYQFGAK